MRSLAISYRLIIWLAALPRHHEPWYWLMITHRIYKLSVTCLWWYTWWFYYRCFTGFSPMKWILFTFCRMQRVFNFLCVCVSKRVLMDWMYMCTHCSFFFYHICDRKPRMRTGLVTAWRIAVSIKTGKSRLRKLISGFVTIINSYII